MPIFFYSDIICLNQKLLTLFQDFCWVNMPDYQMSLSSVSLESDTWYMSKTIRRTPFDIVIVRLPSASSWFSRIESPSLYGIIIATVLHLFESEKNYFQLENHISKDWILVFCVNQMTVISYNMDHIIYMVIFAYHAVYFMKIK